MPGHAAEPPGEAHEAGKEMKTLLIAGIVVDAALLVWLLYKVAKWAGEDE